MKISDERAKVLTDFLNADQERANKLMELSTAEAVKEINSHGLDFTSDELKAYAEAFNKSAVAMGDEDLEEVAGGVSTDVSENSIIPPLLFVWPPPSIAPILPHITPGLPRWL